MIFLFTKSLTLRITLAILLPILILGGIIYFSVSTTLSDFAQNQIQTDMISESRRIYNICNTNFDNLLLSRMADDPGAVIIKKARTLEQIEDYFSQEGHMGFVLDRNNNEIIFQTEVPGDAHTLSILAKPAVIPISKTIDHKEYFVFATDFSPWKWQFVIIRDAQVYSKLINKIKLLQLLTIGSFVMIAVLLIFFVTRSIHGPSRAIISSIERQKRPEYKGVDVFEYLSNTIAGMMDTIRLTEEKYSLVVENTSLIVWELDASYRFTFVSKNILKVLGYTYTEILGEKHSRLTHEDDTTALEQIFADIARTLKPVDAFVHKAHDKEGNTVIFETTALPCLDEAGNFCGYRGISQNITDKVVAQREKQQAQEIAAEQAKQALVGEVAGKMAHDFNNILGVIMGTSELALDQCKEAETKDALQIIFDQTIRGKNLTKNLVAFAKDQEPRHEYFNVNSVIELVLNLMKKDLAGISVNTDLIDNAPLLLADPGMIEHSLVNLIQNSIHALGLKSNPQISIKTRFSEDEFFIEVYDNGCGIPENHLGDIFTPSFTLKGSKDITGSYKSGIKGTGYGMSNIKKYIQQHKGSISIDSKFGEYTRVVLTLPLIKQELTAPEMEKIRDIVFFSGKRILIVEDEISISRVQHHMLSQPPCLHEVQIAVNGRHAIELFKENSFDLISLDFILPGDLNGMDVYLHIRKKNTTIPILFLSGNLEFLESIKNLKENDPYIDHLSKPCQNTEYIVTVNKLLVSITKGVRPAQLTKNINNFRQGM
ncbi:MAG: PAS domain S-box protein [Desulfatiglans sp.]|nr:PAS domain S-box protein [Desulfatiglans sp.]